MSTRNPRPARTATFLMSGLIGAALATSATASRVVERPGVGLVPAYVCVATTVTADGHTKQSSILRRSGNATTDRHALRFVRTLVFRAPPGTTWAELGAQERAAHVLVRMHQNGQMAFKLFEPTEPLPPICYAPFESVARDREINAAAADTLNQ
jgi:TonB family protein